MAGVVGSIVSPDKKGDVLLAPLVLSSIPVAGNPARSDTVRQALRAARPSFVPHRIGTEAMI